MTKNKPTQEEREEIKQHLLKLLKDADNTVYYHVDHVSKSGMTRHIIFYIAPKTGTIYDISYDIARLIDYTPTRRGRGITVNGCGMDMGYHVISSLSMELGLTKENAIYSRNI